MADAAVFSISDTSVVRCGGTAEVSCTSVPVLSPKFDEEAAVVVGCFGVEGWSTGDLDEAGVGDLDRLRAPEGGSSARSSPCRLLGDLPVAKVCFRVPAMPNTFSSA